MDRKKIYFVSLVGFLLTWGVFGSMAATPRSEPSLQATVPQNTAIPPETTNLMGIPVTGEPEPLWADILGFYGLIGLAALFLILALLNFVNKSIAPSVGRKGPPSKKTH
ncbi:MAG TPA: hypothetical protein VJ830_04070 [Anaerolineales bacterium]|nr:hypothetical protein [Anaerolineales bacterium]